MADIKFSKNHNIAACLSDPLEARQEFRSMVHRLKNCRLAHAFQSNLIIYEDLVKQFLGQSFCQEKGNEWGRYVLNEKKNNLQRKRKDTFLIYPRILQMIINAKYLELKGSGDTLDLKSLGLSTFGLMKQNRKVLKCVFQGTKPLEKFVCFADIGIVAPEHVPMINGNDDDEDDHYEGDDRMDLEDDTLGFNDDRDDDGVGMDQEGDLSSFDDDDVYLDFEPNDEDLGSFFDNIDDVGFFPTKTQREENILKLPQQSPEQMDDFIADLDSTMRIPSREVATPNFIPYESNPQETQASKPALKIRREDPSSGVLIRELAQPAQQSTTNVTPS
ncbi:unnamed protein product [Lactuca saligna]|uniref:Uncharacterized protein n=1 Tax=Lactuca saligna TaxID=75948 RepID=A0AA36ELG0_LACSI|nr:unnamed protein product [Lactuca saligna]